MLDSASWLRLIRGLAEYTESGDLTWDQIEGQSGFALISSPWVTRPTVYAAHGNGGYYQLSSGDALGNAPFQLEVWEFVGLKQKPIGSVTSSVNVAGAMELNEALAGLFRLVANKTETGEQIVDRLLGEIRNNGTSDAP